MLLFERIVRSVDEAGRRSRPQPFCINRVPLGTEDKRVSLIRVWVRKVRALGLWWSVVLFVWLISFFLLRKSLCSLRSTGEKNKQSYKAPSYKKKTKSWSSRSPSTITATRLIRRPPHRHRMPSASAMPSKATGWARTPFQSSNPWIWP